MNIVTRAEWDARPPKRRYRIATPTPRLWLHHSASSGTDERAVRAIQNFHMDTRGWSDIAYSFLMDDDAPDIDIFEGRGAGIAGGHTKGDNTQSHAICVIGNYDTRTPNPRTVTRLVDLVAHGYEEGWWPGHITGGHRDAPGANTSCPGMILYRLIPTINRRVAALIQDQEDDMALAVGDEGRAVEAFEAEWNQMADRIKHFRKITVDGKYTPALAGLVRDFQEWAGLTPTGNADGLTAWYLHRLDKPHR